MCVILGSWLIGTLIFKMMTYILWFFLTPTQTWPCSRHCRYSSELDHGAECGVLDSRRAWVFMCLKCTTQEYRVPPVSLATHQWCDLEKQVASLDLLSLSLTTWYQSRQVFKLQCASALPRRGIVMTVPGPYQHILRQQVWDGAQEFAFFLACSVLMQVLCGPHGQKHLVSVFGTMGGDPLMSHEVNLMVFGKPFKIWNRKCQGPPAAKSSKMSKAPCTFLGVCDSSTHFQEPSRRGCLPSPIDLNVWVGDWEFLISWSAGYVKKANFPGVGALRPEQLRKYWSHCGRENFLGMTIQSRKILPLS